jgi:hypothetical protein
MLSLDQAYRALDLTRLQCCLMTIVVADLRLSSSLRKSAIGRDMRPPSARAAGGERFRRRPALRPPRQRHQLSGHHGKPRRIPWFADEIAQLSEPATVVSPRIGRLRRPCPVIHSFGLKQIFKYLPRMVPAKESRKAAEEFFADRLITAKVTVATPEGRKFSPAHGRRITRLSHRPAGLARLWSKAITALIDERNHK